MGPRLLQHRPADPPSAQAVVAVEGLCLAGKTTLVHALAARLGALAVPEYADLAALPPWPPHNREDVTAALLHFLRLEQQRATLARRTPGRLVALDRSPLTLIAHEYGMDRLGVPAAPELAAHMFSEAAERGLILTPDAYVYLRIPVLVSAARQVRRGGLPAHLIDPITQAGIEAASCAYLDALPPPRRVMLDGRACVADLADVVARLVVNLPPVGEQPAPSWRVLTPPAARARADA
ncbi:MAG: AAA family ATPase [Pseudonocardiaceae bacterium]